MTCTCGHVKSEHLGGQSTCLHRGGRCLCATFTPYEESRINCCEHCPPDLGLLTALVEAVRRWDASHEYPNSILDIAVELGRSIIEGED